MDDPPRIFKPETQKLFPQTKLQSTFDAINLAE
jgi:hypothetical protein